MSKIETIQAEIAQMPAAEQAMLADWLDELRAEAWDKQIEADSLAGRLDALAAKARADYQAGRTRLL